MAPKPLYGLNGGPSRPVNRAPFDHAEPGQVGKGVREEGGLPAEQFH